MYLLLPLLLLVLFTRYGCAFDGTAKCFQKDGASGAFLSSELDPNEICPVVSSDTGESVSNHAFRMGLPKKLVPALRKFMDETGIYKAFHSLLIDGHSLDPGHDEFVHLNGFEWHIQRPDTHWNSTMHWISPAGQPAHVKYLQALSTGGFDQVLNALGSSFGFDGLVCYHLTFIGVDFSQKSYLHHDIADTGGKSSKHDCSTLSRQRP